MSAIRRIAFATGKALFFPLLLAAGVLFFIQFGKYLGADALPHYGGQLRDLFEQYPFATVALFTLAVTLGIGFALPLMQLMPLAAGFCFGFVFGAISSLVFYFVGPVITMLLSRYFLGSAVQQKLQKKYGNHLKTFNDGFARDGVWYMLILRHVPLPFFAVNLCMGLTALSVRRFAFINAISLAPGAIANAYLGGVLAELKKPSDLFTPEFITAVTLLTVIPILMAKLAHRWLKNRRNKNQPPTNL